MNETKHSGPVAIALIVLLVLLGAYVGSYVLLLEEGGVVRGVIPNTPMQVEPTYRIRGWLVVVFYRPIHNVDRQLRPERWVTTFSPPP